MNHQAGLKGELYYKPLFVLKYRRFTDLLLIALLAVGFIFFAYLASSTVVKGFHSVICPPFFWLMAILALRALIENVSFKEIRLYNDKIVQVWRWGTTEIAISNAGLKTVHTRAGNVKIIFDQKAKIYSGWIQYFFFFWKAVVYEEAWADPEDAKKLNAMLAYLSGRRVQELENDLDKLIKQGVGPRIIANQTPSEAYKYPDDHDQDAFERSARWPFIFACLMMLSPAALLVAVIVLVELYKIGH
jgi:hypothetical protein